VKGKELFKELCNIVTTYSKISQGEAIRLGFGISMKKAIIGKYMENKHTCFSFLSIGPYFLKM
jgi:hypothetical protein